MSNIYGELGQLLVYRNLLKDELVQGLQAITSAEEKTASFDIAARLIAWAEKTKMTGNIPENYLLCLIGTGENVFSSAAEKAGSLIGKSLFAAAVHDVAILKKLFKAGADSVIQGAALGILRNYHPTHSEKGGYFRNPAIFAALRDHFLDLTKSYSPEEVVNFLSAYHHSYGYGDMVNCVAFRWDGSRGLVGVRHSDPIRLDDIIGYERQKAELVRNTAAFVAGSPANNVLLIGDRGTGKSSSIKAVANQFFDKGVRIVEITKSDFGQLPEIMSALRQWGRKFILFLDDLSFEEFEVEYKLLKSLMDGGVDAKPGNVLIYATSNRRHLVRETWNDRKSDDLHRQDTVNEKISLSDRFGITLYYTSPDQNEYFRIVEELARRNDVPMTHAELKKEALQWEMAHSGRSGRTAQQLITYLLGMASTRCS